MIQLSGLVAVHERLVPAIHRDAGAEAGRQRADGERVHRVRALRLSRARAEDTSHGDYRRAHADDHRSHDLHDCTSRAGHAEA